MFIIHALKMSSLMGWEIIWPLILGIGLSAIIQAVVSHEQITKLLPDDSAKSLTRASLLGAASSSCSYAAVALARSIFKKGGNFSASMAFEMASTNLVIELGIVMLLILGWQFTLAEFIGGPIMIVILAFLFHHLLTKKMVSNAKKQTDKGLNGRMEGHATMDMSIKGKEGIFKKLFSSNGITAVSHFFIMDWASIWIDIVIGLLIAGALSAWVPNSFWQAFFFLKHPLLASFWGPIVGPIIAIFSFVCSVGNVPLAAVLWNSGISFGGVISFIFADLLIIPILLIYKKYYGLKMSAFLLVTFYISMVIAGYIIEGLFALIHLTPKIHKVSAFSTHISLNYTSILNIVFILIAVLLITRFIKTGGRMMLKMMNSDKNCIEHHSN